MLLDSLPEKLLELGLLVGEIVQPRDGPQRPLRDGRPPRHVGQGKDVLADLGHETEQAQDLGDPGTGDALPAGDRGLIDDFAGLEEGLPLEGFAEELDHPGSPRFPGRPLRAPAAAGGGHDLMGGHPARQGADVRAPERRSRAQSHLDHLFAELVPGAVVVASRDVQDPDVDLRRDFPGGSNTVTFGEQKKGSGIPASFRLAESPESESAWGSLVTRRNQRHLRLRPARPTFSVSRGVGRGAIVNVDCYVRTPKNRPKTL